MSQSDGCVSPFGSGLKHCPCVLYLLLPMMKLSMFQVQLLKLSKNEEKRWMKFVSLKVLSRFSHIQLFVTLWTAACQARLSMGFSRQEYWNGLPALLQGIFQIQRWNLSLLSPALAGGFFATSATWEAPPK